MTRSGGIGCIRISGIGYRITIYRITKNKLLLSLQLQLFNGAKILARAMRFSYLTACILTNRLYNFIHRLELILGKSCCFLSLFF